MPRSLFGRLLAISAATTLAALAFAAFAIGHVLERFVTQGLDQRLDAQIAVLAGAVDTRGQFVPARATILPDFADPAGGWRWQVTDAGGRVTGSGAAVPTPLPDPRRGPHDAPLPGEGRGADGERLHFRSFVLPTPSGVVTIVAAAPRRLIARPIGDAMTPLLVSLGLLGLALAVATLVQLRLGLRPLRALQIAVGEVGEGEREHVPEDQPSEIRPLARSLNALIDRNAAGLAHARRHVANLAHGLKTPIAAIGVKLGEPGRDPDGSLTAMLHDVDARIRHHLGRARAAAPGGHVAIAPAIDDLVAVLRRIHGERLVTVDVPADLSAAIDPQDLDELAGNLLDNAWRHAASAIRVGHAAAGAMLQLVIEDDGPGLSDDQLAEARQPGRRLDESGDGHGFGLPIAEEIAELNGGGITLDRSPTMGGLRVTVTLPRAAIRSA